MILCMIVYAVVELKELCNLSVLDISENKVEDVAIIEALVLLKSLCVLYLEGNPVCFKVLPVRSIPAEQQHDHSVLTPAIRS